MKDAVPPLRSPADRVRFIIAVSATLLTLAFVTEVAGWWTLRLSGDVSHRSMFRYIPPPGLHHAKGSDWQVFSMRVRDAAVEVWLPSAP